MPGILPFYQNKIYRFPRIKLRYLILLFFVNQCSQIKSKSWLPNYLQFHIDKDLLTEDFTDKVFSFSI